MKVLRNAFRRLAPRRLVDRYRRWRYGKTWFDPHGMSVRQTFAQIYRDNVWGGPAGEFYSGPGSDPEVAAAYVGSVQAFLRDHGVRSVVDVGCGDFRIGAQLAAAGVEYTGVDVVPELIAHHQAAFARPGVTFLCRDATAEELPPGDVCLVRQVLQHLSNAQIAAVLRHARHFRFLIVTEHVLPDGRAAGVNRDIHHGNETRVDLGSYVALDRPPFGLPVDRVMTETRLPDGSLIRTVLVLQSPAAAGGGS
jgi:SAM-dependent methyltransferase